CTLPRNLVGDGGLVTVYNHKDDITFTNCYFAQTGICIDSGSNDYPVTFSGCTFEEMKYSAYYNYSLKLYAPQCTYKNCAFTFEVDGVTAREGYEDRSGIDTGYYQYVPFRVDGDSKVITFDSCTMNGTTIDETISNYIYGEPTVNIL
ncbi:MAG: hypothetical protein R3Y04_05555, partial [Rikenellaceae bacterium]